MYTPINMTLEEGIKKKKEFTENVLKNDLFPHCKTSIQKKYFMGYMINKLLQTSFGWRKTDDRDSYKNKRLDLTGTLLNNLFRNYFNKLVKDMQKQIIREINNGSWKSTEDYSNIINLTRNINFRPLQRNFGDWTLLGHMLNTFVDSTKNKSPFLSKS